METKQQEQEDQQVHENSRWIQFGAWVKSKRVKRGYKTLRTLADETGISEQTLKVLEKGGWRRRAGDDWILPNPYDDTLEALAPRLGVPVEEMYERVGHYEDRPQTQRDLRRESGKALRGDRLVELEERDRVRERELAEVRERLKALEARFPKQGAAEAPSRRGSRRSSAG
jgi:transcriptional regulator with XRE-family HTH domain